MVGGGPGICAPDNDDRLVFGVLQDQDDFDARSDGVQGDTQI